MYGLLIVILIILLVALYWNAPEPAKLMCRLVYFRGDNCKEYDIAFDKLMKKLPKKYNISFEVRKSPNESFMELDTVKLKNKSVSRSHATIAGNLSAKALKKIIKHKLKMLKK